MGQGQGARNPQIFGQLDHSALKRDLSFILKPESPSIILVWRQDLEE